MFASSLVEQHLRLRLWGVAVEIGRQLGLDADARVLDLGCGDGAFANHTLAANFAATHKAQNIYDAELLEVGILNS